MKSLLLVTAVSIALIACQPEENSASGTTQSPPDTPAPAETDTVFSAAQAKNNLRFAKTQYLKMIDNIEADRHLKWAEACRESGNVCFPRAQEDHEIYMERKPRWTNGFWPGVLWKLLAAGDSVEGFDEAEKKRLRETAERYTTALRDQAARTNTHDLGFLVYDSFGEALEYPGLGQALSEQYKQPLIQGRASLATRYGPEHGLIKSWDWTPVFRVHPLVDGEFQNIRLPLRNPWQFPVIVDNMMNLEYLLTSDDPKHHEIAYSHAEKTLKHHYHYLADDPERERPMAYHVFDYDTMRPGNWQGMGNVSVWARGQGWSLYGFVSVAEFAKKQAEAPVEGINFEAFADTLVGSIEHLLRNDPVPDWDLLAKEPAENTTARAANQSADTAEYSHILGLCSHLIPSSTLPYNGYQPIRVEANLVSDEGLKTLEGLKSATGELMLQGEDILPCGSKDYDLRGRAIPKDTSAAGLYAAALYRFAQFTDEPARRQRYIALADRIMAALTERYRTDVAKDKSFDLGFVVAEATGNLPSYSEIALPIVYGDFYFVEANMRKLALASED